MTFQSSGAAYISAVGTECGLSLPYYGRDSAIRTLCGTGTGTLHLLTDAYGKSYVVYSTFGGTMSKTISSGTAGMYVYFGTGGGITTTAGLDTNTVDGDTWLTSGTPPALWIRCTKISGTATMIGDTGGSFIPFDSQKYWGFTWTYPTGKTLNVLVDIATDSIGINIVASNTISMEGATSV